MSEKILQLNIIIVIIFINNITYYIHYYILINYILAANSFKPVFNPRNVYIEYIVNNLYTTSNYIILQVIYTCCYRLFCFVLFFSRF